MSRSIAPVNRTCPTCAGRGTLAASDFGAVTLCSDCRGTRFVQVPPSTLHQRLGAVGSFAELLMELHACELEARQVAAAAQALGECVATDCCAVEIDVLAAVRGAVARLLGRKVRLAG